MKNLYLRWLFCLALGGFLNSTGYGDEILLKTGEKVEGTIVDKDSTSIKIKTGETEITFFNDEITSFQCSSCQTKPFNNTGSSFPVYRITSFPKPSAGKNTKKRNPAKELNKQKPQEIGTTAEWSFNKAMITYSIRGTENGLQKGIGQVIVYIDKTQNKIAALYTYTISTAEKDVVVKTKEMYDGDTFMLANYSSHRGLKIKNNGNLLPVFFHQNLYTNSPMGSGKVLGHDCRVYSNANTVGYFWNGILLRELPLEASKNVFKIIKEAITLKINPQLPQDAFSMPASIDYKTSTELDLNSESILMRQDYLQTEEGKSITPEIEMPSEKKIPQQPKNKITSETIKEITALPEKIVPPPKIEPPLKKTSHVTTYSPLDGIFKMSIPLDWLWNEQEGEIVITNPENTAKFFCRYTQKSLSKEESAKAYFKTLNEEAMRDMAKPAGNISEKKAIVAGLPALRYELDSTSGPAVLINFYNETHAFIILFASNDENERQKMETISTSFEFLPASQNKSKNLSP